MDRHAMSRPRDKSKRASPKLRPATDASEAGSERFVAETFGPLPGYEHAHRYLAASLIFGRGKVLDLASGSGAGTALLRARGNGDRTESSKKGRRSEKPARDDLQVIGLDLDLDSARRAAPAVQADAIRLPFADGSFDGVICFETIEHLEKPARLLKEIRRVLRSNGVALLSTPNRDVFTMRAGRHNPFHVSEMNTTEFRKALEAVYPHSMLYAQSVWSGSWLSEMDEGDVPVATSSKRPWHVGSEDLAPDHDSSLAPWADREDARLPIPLYTIAVCADSARALERARRQIGQNHLLHDRAQWLMGHYLRSLEGLAERDVQIESHASHARNLQKDLETSRERIADLEEHARNADAGDVRLNRQLEALRAHAANVSDLEAATRTHAVRVEEHAENLGAELGVLRKQAEAALEHAANVETERGPMLRRVSELEEHGRNLERELIARSTHSSNLEEQVVGLQARIAELEEHGQNLFDESARLEGLIPNLEEHSRNLENELESRIRHARILEDELRSRTQHTQNLEAELETRSQHAENLEEELESRSHHARNLETDRELLEARIAELHEHAANLDEILRGQLDHVSNLESERPRLQDQISMLETQAGTLERQLLDRSARVDDLEGEVVALSDRARVLDGELEAAVARATGLEGKLGSERDRFKSLEREAERLGSDRDTWRARAESAETEVKDLRSSRTVRFVTWLRERLSAT